MKCSECGQWNRASMPHCIKCGAPLNIDEAVRITWKESLRDGGQSTRYLRADEFGQTEETPESRDALAKEMHELKRRKQEGEKKQADLKESVEESHEDPDRIGVGDSSWEEIGDSNDGAVVMRRISSEDRKFKAESELRHRIRYLDDNGAYLESRTYDPLYADSEIQTTWSYDRTKSSLPGQLNQKKNSSFSFLKGFLCVLLGCFLVFIGFIVYRNFISPSSRKRVNTTASVTASMMDDLAAHTILIPGEDGTQIYIRETHSSYVVTDGFASVQIADHTWYDNFEGVLDETMDVTLTPFLKTSSGKQTPLDPIAYTIAIPLSPITLETPDSLRTEVSTTMSTIQITVRPGSRVTVNGNDCSDTVSSESGLMSYNATVQPIGDNEFTITVRSQYCRDNTITVTLYRAPQEIPLDLAVGTYGTTNEKIMKVTATTLPGAYVDVSTPHSDLDITDLDSTGKFTFNAVFDHIGYNTISISSSYPGKKTSVVEHTVYYLPPASEYTVKAWPLTPEGYSELLSNINVRAERSQVYLITGIVQYSVSDKPQMVVINTSEDGKSQPVLVQNYTNTVWQVGTYYRIYADAYSTYNSMPWLNARFTYTK